MFASGVRKNIGALLGDEIDGAIGRADKTSTGEPESLHSIGMRRLSRLLIAFSVPRRTSSSRRGRRIVGGDHIRP
jgi:hypothetical protein